MPMANGLLGIAALNPTYTVPDHTELPPLPLGEGWGEGTPGHANGQWTVGLRGAQPNPPGPAL